MAENWLQVVGNVDILNRVKVPRPGIDKVYKDECMFSFDTPESETGLYVSLTSFWGLARDHVESYYRKTGNPLFLHIRRIKKKVPKPVSNEGPEKKITRLAIGVEGGFDDGQNFIYESEEFYHLAVLPSFQMIQLPNDQLPSIVLDSIAAIQAIDSASKLAELETMAGTWDGEARQPSKHSTSLEQLDNGKKIPPQGWRCEAPDCNFTNNLWLNLTDGSILCGRKFYDGSGGNNHAIEHYNKFKYPLAVKLGTITPDGRADVYSYDEDDMVEDTKLVEHLAHFGINVAVMEKTDKSMAEMEIELNQRKGEWDTIQEAGKKLKPLYGPGFTGLVNLGNTCYLNSIMQVLFSLPAFEARFLNNASKYFESSSDPVNDFNVQMAKMCLGLLSGKYSQNQGEDDTYRTGISPWMFRTLIGKGHSEFSTKKQQDAQEFFLHLITTLEKNSGNDVNPAECFKFQVEEKILCKKTGRVRYTYRNENCLPLTIPLERAVNKEELNEYEERKKLAEANGQKLPPESLVRPKIPFDACIDAFLAEGEVREKIPGEDPINIGQNRMASFPDYLAIMLSKYTYAENWTPMKLDVSVDMPYDLDLSGLRAQGPQPGEVLIAEEKKAASGLAVDDTVVNELVQIGFNPNASRKAVIMTANKGLEAATNWMMQHLDDPDINTPYEESSSNGQVSNFVPDEAGLQNIVSMGFTQDQAKKALRATDNNVLRAVDWIFSHIDELDNVAPTEEASTSPPKPKFSDGPGQYKLLGFVSHMGTSTMVGHYVCHIWKDGKWAIFNDEKVAESENLPKDLGYLYFYKRV